MQKNRAGTNSSEHSVVTAESEVVENTPVQEKDVRKPLRSDQPQFNCEWQSEYRECNNSRYHPETSNEFSDGNGYPYSQNAWIAPNTYPFNCQYLQNIGEESQSSYLPYVRSTRIPQNGMNQPQGGFEDLRFKKGSLNKAPYKPSSCYSCF